MSKLDDMPFLACNICGQEVHKPCFMVLLGIVSDTEAADINPHNLPGIHYLCKECENQSIPAIDSAPESFSDSQLSVSFSQTTVAIDSTQVPEPSLQLNETVDDPLMSESLSPEEQSSLTQPEIDQSSLELGSCDKPDDLLTQTNDSFELNKSNNKICVHYRRNQLKYGMKGKDCPFLHPTRCKKLLVYGTKQPDGCNLGRKCTSFHPKMCPSSITKRICFDDKCQFTHVKGTKRKPSRRESSKMEAKIPDKNQPKASLSESSKSTLPKSPDNLQVPAEDPTSKSSFLEMISLLKKELCEAMDTKIAMSLSQIPHFYPRLQNPTHFPIPFQFQMPPYPTMPPQNPPQQNQPVSL